VRDQQCSAIFSKKEDLVLDSEHFCENFRRLEQGKDRVMLEMVVESSHNSRLKKGMYEHRLKVYDVVIEHLNRQIEKGFIKKGIDVNGVASAFVALYDGLTVCRMLGISDASNKKAWVAMVRAVMEGIGG
jgi:hypothetical protein